MLKLTSIEYSDKELVYIMQLDEKPWKRRFRFKIPDNKPETIIGSINEVLKEYA